LLTERHFPEATITDIDCDTQALAASATLACNIDFGHKIESLHATADNVSAFAVANSDVVYLASLFGLSPFDRLQFWAQSWLR
jgi:trans-aconitate methyltransferase